MVRDSLLKGRSSLSPSDQELAYPAEEIDKLINELEEIVPKSCNTTQPVVDAYIDAVSNLRPKRCYMVNGGVRKYLDGFIVSTLKYFVCTELNLNVRIQNTNHP